MYTIYGKQLYHVKIYLDSNIKFRKLHKKKAHKRNEGHFLFMKLFLRSDTIIEKCVVVMNDNRMVLIHCYTTVKLRKKGI